MSKTKLYGRWAAMKQRCYNKNIVGYHRYGGRGIEVCESWHDFINFKKDMEKSFHEHAKKHGYGINTSLNRINNDLGYSKDNCEWTTLMGQSKNKKTNTYLEFNGKKQTYAEWARETGVRSTAIRYRLEKGWSVKDTLTIPVSQQNSKRNKKKHDKT